MSPEPLLTVTDEQLPPSPLLHPALHGVNLEEMSSPARLYTALHVLGMQVEEDADSERWPGIPGDVPYELVQTTVYAQMLRACADGLAAQATPVDPDDVTGLRALGRQVYIEVRASLADDESGTPAQAEVPPN